MNNDGGEPFHLLLVEDDDGDAFLVEELLAEAGLSPDLTRAWSLQAALDALTVPVDCVLLDLGLPDATGLDALIQLRAASDAAFVVLTGFDGIDGGVEAVAAGAEDYLVKGRVDGESLGRALRYAVERRRGERERSSRSDAGAPAEHLTAVMHQLRHDAPPAGVRVTVRGDGGSDPLSTEMFELVARPDETILTLFGHVVGNGPAAPAQAALLRASFRALALAGLPLPDLLEAFGRVARSSAVEACVVVLDLDPGRRRASVAEAGHVGPVLIRGSEVRQIAGSAVGAPLGAAGDLARQVIDVVLEEPDRLLLLGARFAAWPTERAPDAVDIDLRDVLAAGGGMDDDTLADAVVEALRSAAPEPAGGHLVLLGWTAG